MHYKCIILASGLFPKNHTGCYNWVMKFLKTYLGYLKWHYGKALITTFSFWKNILVFLFVYFSIGPLFGNFFTPWKRLADSYPEKFSFKTYLSAFLANTIMRTVGMVLRLIIILFGVACCIAFIIFLPISIVIWLALPLIIIFLIVSGLILIIFS